jgi:hypothetical protein
MCINASIADGLWLFIPCVANATFKKGHNKLRVLLRIHGSEMCQPCMHLESCLPWQCQTFSCRGCERACTSHVDPWSHHTQES